MLNVLVFFGAGLGGLARFLFGKAITDVFGKNFPHGTLIINLSGAFIMGCLYVIINQKLSSYRQEMSSLFLVGVLGGYTTFSSFSNEALQLLNSGRVFVAITYVTLSVVLGLIAVFLGECVGKLFL